MYPEIKSGTPSYVRASSWRSKQLHGDWAAWHLHRVGCLVVLENTPRHHHHLGNETSLKDKDQAGVQLLGAIVP